ncbi:hypothetical protein TorRG33x02_203360, partial [Trema orientale]
MSPIFGIEDVDGRWRDKLDDTAEVIETYYTFLSFHPGSNDFEAIIEKVEPQVTFEMSQNLLKPFTKEDVKTA